MPRLVHYCPKCGSNHVQSVESAYTQSIRHGRDFSTISEFGQRMAPPERKSVVLFPAIAGGWALVVVMALICLVLEPQLLIEPRTLVQQESRGYVAIALVVALAVALGFARAASRYNSSEYPELTRAWESAFVCRSCLHRYQASEQRSNR